MVSVASLSYSPDLVTTPIISQLNTVCFLTSYLFDTHFNIDIGWSYVFFFFFKGYFSDPKIPVLSRFFTICYSLGWVNTCNVTTYRNAVSWQCGRDSWPRNVSKVGYAVTLRACSVDCRYLVVAWKEWYGYGLSRSGRATWHVTTATLSFFSLKSYVYKCTKPLLAAKTSLGLS